MTSIGCLDVKHKYNLGIEFNRTINRLEQEGKIISRRIYSGTKEIGPLEIVRITSGQIDLLGNQNKKGKEEHGLSQ